MEEPGEIRQSREGGVFLCIDLNEMPEPSSSSLDPYSVVKRYHENVASMPGMPAELPEASSAAVCGICGGVEAKGGVIICDGCERGFHLSCLNMRRRRAAELEDWVCGDCQKDGRTSGRWKLGTVIKNGGGGGGGGERRRSKGGSGGGAGKRMLDINALPPAESESDAGDGAGAGAGGGETPTSNSSFRKKIWEDELLLRESSAKVDVLANGFGSMVSKESDKRFGDLDGAFYKLRSRSSSEGVVSSFRPRRRDKLQALSRMRVITSTEDVQNHAASSAGFRGDGHLLYDTQSSGSFFTMTLGTIESSDCLGGHEEFPKGVVLAQKASPLSNKKRKALARLRTSDQESLTASSGFDSQDVVRSISAEPCEDTEVVELDSCNYKNKENDTEAVPEGSDSLIYQTIDFPIQFEDFFLQSIGNIDSRPSYHEMNHIWPIGYQSSWHDEVTGSYFKCMVVDGGDSGPIFKVRRSPCSTVSLPHAPTVLSYEESERLAMDENVEPENSISKKEDDQDEEIKALLVDPTECLSSNLSNLDGNFSFEVATTYFDKCSAPQNSYKHLECNDAIGDFIVEERSSSSAWGLVSKVLLDACREAVQQTGSLTFSCNHKRTSPLVVSDDGSKTGHDTNQMSKFRSATGPSFAGSLRSESDLDFSFTQIGKWLDKDRFGLDIGLIQELIEKMPRVQTCSRYIPLAKRCSTGTQSLGNGLLLSKRSRGEGAARNKGSVDEPEAKEKSPPPGRPLSFKLPSALVGDVLQIWQLLWRFYELLGLKEPLSFEELEDELVDPWCSGPSSLEKLEKEMKDFREPRGKTGSQRVVQGDPNSMMNTMEDPHAFVQLESGPVKEVAQPHGASHSQSRCTGVALTKAHISLLRLLVSELQSKILAVLDPSAENGEPKSRRGRKRDYENSVTLKRQKVDLVPINELTWPELARRYILVVLAMDETTEPGEITARDCARFLRCLRGDGAVLCGALSGLAGMEVDALLLAEAERQVSDSGPECSIPFVDSEEWASSASHEKVTGNTTTSIPEWAQILEPVRKLPTNVGTRIRKCIYEALKKDPPDWAREILLHSISKDVYKSNASGPTKKAVLSVLAEVAAEGGRLQRSEIVKKQRSGHSFVDIIMKQCQVILRRSIASDEAKIFSNLLGTTLSNLGDNEDEGVLGPPAKFPRPLDFRTIDLRLSVGAYVGSHEAFLADVREVWDNIRKAYGDRPDLIQLADNLSQNFESLYENEVLTIVQKLKPHSDTACSSSTNVLKEAIDIIGSGNEIPKAPWEEGVCKVCGIDRDDESVLLCDKCDSEYHTYCLTPPLARIPEGNWYCPSCITSQYAQQHPSSYSRVTSRQSLKKNSKHLRVRALADALNQLTSILDTKEYWDFDIEERILLLKFLCDEALNSIIFRAHLERCQELSVELQSKLKVQSTEWRSLKSRDALRSKIEKETGKSSGSVNNGVSHGRNGISIGQWIGQQQMLINGVDLPNVSISSQQNVCNRLDALFSDAGQNGFRRHQGLSFPHSLEEGRIGQAKEDLFLGKNYANGGAFPVLSTDLKDKYRMHKQHILQDQKIQEGSKRSRESEVSTGPHSFSDLEMLAVDNLGPSCDLNLKDNTTRKSGTGTRCVDFSSGVTTRIAENVLTPFSLTVGEQPFGSPGVSCPNACDGESDPVRQELQQLEESINQTEFQLLKTCIRREFLGRDTFGRLYWSFSRLSGRPWLVADGSRRMENKARGGNTMNNYVNLSGGSQSDALYETTGLVDCLDVKPISRYLSLDSGVPVCDWHVRNRERSSPWIVYESDVEILELVHWLQSSKSSELDLSEWMIQLERYRGEEFRCSVSDDPQTNASSRSKSSEADGTPTLDLLKTQASAVLEKKYGPCFEPDASDVPRKRGKKARMVSEEKMFRCECLEPVWPCRYHCVSCHQTFSTAAEIGSHNDGNCSSAPDDSKENDELLRARTMTCDSIPQSERVHELDALDRSKNVTGDLIFKYGTFRRKVAEESCPYDINEIAKTFVTKDSNKELVKQIGFLGSGRSPSLVSAPKFVPLFDPALLLEHPNGILSPVACSEQSQVPSTENDRNNTCAGASSLSSMNGRTGAAESDKHASDRFNRTTEIASDRILETGASKKFEIPDTSLRPLSGRICRIIRQLKINLLDMDAALPEEALHPKKSSSPKRRSWRSFVKASQSIFQMVQATIILENMIKSEYLKTGWWYWSSLSAAAKISTVTSLALRIYALDDAIIYENITIDAEPEETPRPSRPGKKKKESDE